MKRFELNILYEHFWQMDYNMLTEYWIVKIQYCNYLHNNTIGQIIRYQDYYWSSIKLKIVEMFFVRLVDVSHGWRNRGDPNKVNEQDKRLTTQVVFTAANLKTPLTCLSCLAFLLCVRACALCLWCLSALESSWKRELSNKGLQDLLAGSLFLIFHKYSTRTSYVILSWCALKWCSLRPLSTLMP